MPKCIDCTHVGTDIYKQPCISCFAHSKFEPKEKEKKTMSNKTRAELLDLIDEKDAEIKDLKEEIKNLEKYEKYKEVADEMKAIHMAMVDTGFTEEQAFELMKTLISANMNRPRLF